MNITRRKVLLMTAGVMPLMAGRWLTKQIADPHIAQEFRLVQDRSYALGTNISVTVAHPDIAVAKTAIAAALSEVHLIDRVMSLYRPQSQISQLNQQGWLDSPHPDLVEVLSNAQAFSKLSAGAFDVTVQPLWQLYAQAQARGGLPTMAAIAQAQQKVNWRNLEVSATRIQFTKLGMAITLNGIAQGFASDRVLTILKSYGIENALLYTGEIGSLGQKTTAEPWTVGVQHPRDPNTYIGLLHPRNSFVATSGDYATSFDQDYTHHHIFDPATGRSPGELSSVTVIAATGIEADGLSTAIFVLGANKGLALVKQIPLAAAILMLKDGRVLVTEDIPGIAANVSGEMPIDTQI